MAASTLKSYNTFVKGIITEAGPLTYPEDAWVDGENVVPNREGSNQRRLGMDFEGDAVLQPVTLLSDDAVASFLWTDAANNTENQFAAVQVGQRLLIFDASQPSISANLLTNINLAAYITGKTAIQAESGAGVLWIQEGTSDPLYIEYNQATSAFTVNVVDVKVRDFFGLDDGLDVDEQPASLSTAHNYNLRNQGWPSDKITAYHASGAVYPSNAQQWFLGRKESDNTFDVTQLKAMEFGTSKAPKGKFVISLFDRSAGRNAASGLSTTSDIELSRPSCGAFANSRMFYAGMESTTPLPLTTSPNVTGMVLYSRTMRSPKDAGQCYSDADPTSEIDSELVDTDGGYIIIPDSGKIHRLASKGSSIVVFAEQGVWEIAGDEGGFRATSNQVRKISNFGVVAPQAVVDTEAEVYYWNRGGIYQLAASPETGRLVAGNITENSIQSLYNALDQETKRNAVGSYDPVNRRVSWMYNDDLGYTGATFRNRYNKELVLDLALEAWYKNSISAHSEPSPYIAGYLSTPDFLLRKEGIRNRFDSVTKYTVVQFIDPPTNSASITFAYYRDEALRDWRSSDNVGTSFLSYILTGQEIMGDTTRPKQAPYMFVHMKQTEKFGIDDPDNPGQAKADNPSGLLVQTRWDWSDNSISGKWSEPFQAYRLLKPYTVNIGEPIDYGQEVVTTKNKIFGQGKALQLLISSDGDKDFYIYGWAIRFTGKQNV